MNKQSAHENQWEMESKITERLENSLIEWSNASVHMSNVRQPFIQKDLYAVSRPFLKILEVSSVPINRNQGEP